MFWSSTLARLLAQAVPEAALLEAWSSVETGSESEAEVDELRAQLGELSMAEPEVRVWLAEAWRASRGEVVRATERLAIEELADAADLLARRFEVRELLLAVLTETREDTAENLALLLESTTSARVRSLLEREWKALQASPRGAAKRLALVGGHASEAERLRSLESRMGVRFDWIPADKRKGLGSAHSALSDLCEAQAILVVTGNVSHSTMHCAKRAAERLDVPCGFLERLTERRLASCLAELSLEGKA